MAFFVYCVQPVTAYVRLIYRNCNFMLYVRIHMAPLNT